MHILYLSFKQELILILYIGCYQYLQKPVYYGNFCTGSGCNQDAPNLVWLKKQLTVLLIMSVFVILYKCSLLCHGWACPAGFSKLLNVNFMSVKRLTLSTDNEHFGLQCCVHLSYFDMSDDWCDSHMDQHHLHEKTLNQNAHLLQKIWMHLNN